MSIETPILTKKYRKHIIRQLRNQQDSAFNYGQDGDFFKEVIASMGSGLTFMLEEIISDDIKAVIDEDSKVDLKQVDFFGYAEKVIKLPKQYAVQVSVATLDHMEIQKASLIENYLRQTRAFVLHHDQIVMPIIETMQTHGFRTAGEALQILQANPQYKPA